MRNLIVQLLPVLLLCSSFAAGQIIPPNAPNPNARYQFSGRVLDADTGDPIAGARVTVRGVNPNTGDLGPPLDFLARTEPPPQVLILTDAAGAFQVNNAPAGSYWLSAERAEYRTINFSSRSSYGSISLPAPGSEPIQLHLRRGGVIQGTALDQRGVGLKGSAAAFKLSVVDGRWRPLHAMSVSTDSEGAFRLAGLEPGRYYLAFSPQPNNLDAGTAYPLTIYPDSADLTGAKMVTLRAGGEERVYFRPQPQRTYEVSGVFGPNLVLSDAYWTVRSSFPSGLPISPSLPAFTAQQDHSFQVKGLLPGEYTLQANKGTQLYGPTTIVVGASNLTGLVLDPTPPVISLQGVTNLDANPSIIATGINPGAAGQNLGSYASLQFRSDTADAVNSQMKPDGTFSVDRIQPGDYRVTVRTDNRRYVKSLRQGNRDVLRDGLHIAADSQPLPLEMEVGDGHARVEATIAAAGLAESAHVWVAYLRHQGAEWIPQYQTHMQMHGINQISFPEPLLPGTHRVLATDMPPGEYIVMAWLDDNIRVDQLPYNTEEFQTQYRSYLVNLTLGETGTTTTIEIPRLLPPTAFADFPTPPPSR